MPQVRATDDKTLWKWTRKSSVVGRAVLARLNRIAEGARSVHAQGGLLAWLIVHMDNATDRIARWSRANADTVRNTGPVAVSAAGDRDSRCVMPEQSMQIIHAEDNGRFVKFLAHLQEDSRMEDAVSMAEIYLDRFGLDIQVFLDEYKDPIAVLMFPKKKGQP